MNNNKEANPLVSIVVPAYNVEKYLARSIESMVGQTYENIEILLVNDGSKDDTGSIADRYAKLYDSLTVIHQINSGVSVARNVGIDSAKGEFVTFVDPDDYLELDAIENMVKLAQKHDVDILRTRCNTYRNDRKIDNDYGIETGLYEGAELKELSYRAALHYSHDAISCCWLLLVKKSVLELHGVRFAEGIIIMQDTWFYVDLLRTAGSLYAADVVTYNYMINDSGTISSSSRFAEKVDCIVRLYEHNANLWQHYQRDQLRAQYSVLVAIRTVNSSNGNLAQAREMLKVTSKYKNIFRDSKRAHLNMRHRLYADAVWNNKAWLVVVLAFARKVAISVKG